MGKEDVFVRKKIGLAAAVLLLVCLMILCHKAGETLRRGIEESRETGAQTAKNDNLIVLDAGHGGIDAGKLGVNGAEEKEINFKIAIYTKELLEKEGIQVVMTRSDDGRLGESQVEDLKARVSVMNENRPALAVSIHQNSYHEESVKGPQVFYYTDSKEGEKAAGIIQNSLAETTGDHSKEAKANNTYYILKKTEVPVVIVECGFLSNYEEAEKLAQEEYQRQIAQAVARGIAEYVGADGGR